MQKKHVYASLALLAALAGRYQWNASKQVAYEDDSDVKVARKKREPASVKLGKSKPQPFKAQQVPAVPETRTYASPEVPRDDRDDSYGGGGGSSTGSQSMVYSGGGYGGGSGYSSTRDYSPSPSSPAKPTDSAPKEVTVWGGGGVGGSTGGGGDTGSTGGGDTGGGSGDSLTCSSSVGGGAYSYPISVALTCDSSATIKYCISTGACCDPKAVGNTYSSNLVVGSPEGSYCVSFYGVNSNGTESSVVSTSYNIDSTSPDLVTAQPQTFYQTTELSGVTKITSNDFGKTGYAAGVINLKSNDPGPTGLNATCEEIVTEYVSFPAPAPVEVMALYDVSSLTTTQEMSVPLILNHLIYGDNFITSYIKNSNYAAPLYSCSTTKVRLEDFEYFEMGMNIPNGATSVPQNAEFVGGFYPYRFADAVTVTRGPASEDINGQKLDTNLFSIFY